MVRFRLGIAFLLFALAMPGLAFAKNTLAEAYIDAGMDCLHRNESEKALRLFTLAIQEAAECESADVLPIALLGAGEAEFNLGNFDKARQLFRTCAQFQDTVNDDENPVIRVAAMCNLMLVQTHEEEFIEAEAVGQKAVAILEAADLGDHELMAKTLNNLSIAKTALEKFDEAKEIALRSQKILKAISDEHPASYEIADTLAHIYHAAKDHDRAEEAAKTAVEHARQHHGERTVQTAEALTTLGKIKRSQGHHAESEKALKLALEIFAETTHDDHPSHQAAKNLSNAKTEQSASQDETAPSSSENAKEPQASPSKTAVKPK